MCQIKPDHESIRVVTRVSGGGGWHKTWGKGPGALATLNFAIGMVITGAFIYNYLLSYIQSLGIYKRLVSGALVYTKIHRCPSSFYEMAQYLHTT